MGVERARSAGRAFEVLRVLARSRGPVSAQTLADACGIPRSSSYQLLQVMREHRLVEYNPDERNWSLGIGVLELGAAYQRSGGLQQRSGPQLEHLTDQTGHTSHLAVLDGAEVVYLAKREPGTGGIRLVTEVGSRLPADRTAVGKAILAQLPAQELAAGHGPRSADQVAERSRFQELARELHLVRRRGYAVDDGQITPGITCVAAAVFGADALVVAAVGVSYLTATQDEVGHRATIAAVSQVARELSTDLAPAEQSGPGGPCTRNDQELSAQLPRAADTKERT